MISQTSERHSLEDASKDLSRMLHFSCSIEEDVYFQCKKEMVPARPEIDMVLVKLIDILGEIAIGIFWLRISTLLAWGFFFPSEHTSTQTGFDRKINYTQMHDNTQMTLVCCETKMASIRSRLYGRGSLSRLWRQNLRWSVLYKIMQLVPLQL